jgi:hypothetical protein
VARTAGNAAARRRLLAAMLAIVALVAVVASACLTTGARQSPHPTASPQAGHHGAATHAESVERVDGPEQVHATTEPAVAEHQCPDQGPPVPACHNQADLQLTTHAAGPRPDADLHWDHPRYAAERAGLPGSPFADPAPDLIALSISRT